MDMQENARARAEAQKSTMSGADRARFWAGLNRYLAAEAVREHEASEREREHEASERERTDDEKPDAD